MANPLNEEYERLQREFDEAEDDPSKFEKHSQLITAKIMDTLHKLKGGHPVGSTLYDYQIEAVIDTAKFIKDSEHLPPEDRKMALIVAPPGSGKSGMVTLLPYVLASKKVLILTPSKIISEQLAVDFGHYMHSGKTMPFLVKSGMFEGGKVMRLLEPVQLAQSTQDVVQCMARGNLVILNAQKFAGNSATSLTSTNKQDILVELNKFDTIIVDEAHHYPAATWENIVNAFIGKKVVFLTATPYRGSDDKALTLLGALETVHEIPLDKLTGITIRKTEFYEKPADSETLTENIFLSQLSEDINDILSKHRTQEARDEPPQAMILVRTKMEAKEVATGLGDGATYIVADKNCDKNLADFTQGKKKIGVVCGMLREGYDNPNVSLVVFLRKCSSRVLFEQFCGRCIRMKRGLIGKHADKTIATVLSYTHFEQSKMWAVRMKPAEVDPVEEEEVENDGGE